MTGKQIADLREALGLNVTELAAAIGVSYQTVYRWEAEVDEDSGCKGTGLIILQAIADAVSHSTNERVAAKLRQGLRKVVSFALSK